mgnify:FL=1
MAMKRLTFEGNFCDIAQCTEIPGGSFCEDGACSQRKVWERLRAYEDTGLMPEEIIRCRSCANFRQNAHGVCYCNEYGGAITPEDYCSRAVLENEPPAK